MRQEPTTKPKNGNEPMYGTIAFRVSKSRFKLYKVLELNVANICRKALERQARKCVAEIKNPAV